jgi:DnaJ-class molecular chaperone
MKFKVSKEDIEKLGYEICKPCRGTGVTSYTHVFGNGHNTQTFSGTCSDCKGKGYMK